MKYFIVFFLIVSSIYATAQNESVEVLIKGTKFIGGTLFFNYNDDIYKSSGDDSKIKNISASLGIVSGKYIANNLAIGLIPSYSFSEDKSISGSGEAKMLRHSITTTFFLRKSYKIVPNLFFYFQGQPSASLNLYKQIDAINNETQNNGYSVGVAGTSGLQVFLSKKISIESSLFYAGYQFRHTKESDSENQRNTHSVDFGGGLGSINFSVRYFIYP